MTHPVMEGQCQAGKAHLKHYKEPQLLRYGGHIGTRRKVGASGRGCALRTLCVRAGSGGGSYGLFRPGIFKLWCVINHLGIFQMQDVIQWAWGGTQKSTGFIRSQVLGPCPRAPEAASITGHGLQMPLCRLHPRPAESESAFLPDPRPFSSHYIWEALIGSLNSASSGNNLEDFLNTQLGHPH